MARLLTNDRVAVKRLYDWWNMLRCKQIIDLYLVAIWFLI